MGKKIVFLAMIPVAFVAMLGWVQAQGNQPHLLALLVPTLKKCEWKVQTLTGGPKGVMLLHQAKMRRILSELRAGQPVNPKEIEEIMKEHPKDRL